MALDLPPGARRDCALLAAGALAAAALLRPFQDAPFVDDWVYAWPVRHLLETGELAVTEYSTSPQLAQTLWGALFCLPFGFSFTALRVSTWTLWIALLCAVYLLTRELGGRRRNALAAASGVALNPTTFMLAFTFMTDIPFLAATAWSAWLLVRGLERRRAELVWAAAAVACLAVACRPTGIGIAAAMAATLLFHTGRWGRRLRLLAAPSATAAFTAAIFLYARAHVLRSADVSGVQNAPDNRFAGLTYALDILPSTLPLSVAFAVGYTGVLLLPLALGLARRAPARRLAGTAALLAAGWGFLRYLGHGPFVPLSACHTWSFAELGMAACLVPGAEPSAMPAWMESTLAAGALLSGSVLLTAIGAPPKRDGHAALVWLLLAQLGLAAILWLYNFDRYSLPFVVLGAALVMARSQEVVVAPLIAGLALYGTLSGLGVRDHLAYNRALWTAVAGLRANGVPAGQIDAGYVVNGWLQYTRPEEAHRDESGELAIPMVNTQVRLPYTIANRPLPDAVIVRAVPYDGWLYPPGELYVLRAPLVAP